MDRKESYGVIIQGLDTLDVITFIRNKNKKYQAILLSDIEKVISRDSPEFKIIRKLVLDSSNEFTRSVLRIIFGDIEGL